VSGRRVKQRRQRGLDQEGWAETAERIPTLAT